MDTGTDLLLLAIDPDSGQTRFGPRLSYALPVAEPTDLVRAGRLGLDEDNLVVINAKPTGEAQADSALTVLAEHSGPLSVASWVKWRGPRRIDPYLHAAVDAGFDHERAGRPPGGLLGGRGLVVTAQEHTEYRFYGRPQALRRDGRDHGLRIRVRRRRFRVPSA